MNALLDVARQYRVIRPLGQQSGYLLTRTTEIFSTFLGHAATVADLDDLTVSSWLEWCESRYAKWTVAGLRTRILSLWRFAARRKLCGGPGEVRRAPAPVPMPRAWSVDEVGRLVRAAKLLNPRAAAYFGALIPAAYESGLRKGDLQRLLREQIRSDGIITIRQNKTQQPHVVSVRPETAAAILALPGDPPLRCPWSTARYGELWARLRSMADLHSGGLQQLRRTGATWVAAEHGIEAARQFLGHRTGDMWRHYVDQSLASPRPWLPPRPS